MNNNTIKGLRFSRDIQQWQAENGHFLSLLY